MLTYNEQLWLAWKKRISRMKNVSAAWCHKCPHLGRNAAGCYGEPFCPLFPDMQDALEFEGMVAALLARMMLRPNEYKYPCRNGVPELGCMREMTALTGPYAVHCEDCILREVRLQVEEEMEA